MWLQPQNASQFTHMGGNGGNGLFNWNDASPDWKKDVRDNDNNNIAGVRRMIITDIKA